ncbi:MAG: DUF4230 domain-containing protein [Candidatus Sericytochromatia bacterium]
MLLATLLLGSALGALGFWRLSHEPSVLQRQVLLEKIQHLQRLEVLEARLLAHQSVRRPAWFNTHEFVVLARGRALYGVDLAQAELAVDGTRVTLTLPRVELQELIVPPDSVEFIGMRKGLLSSQQDFEDFQREALLGLQAELGRQARDPALLQQAQERARQVLTPLLQSLGFREIEVKFRSAPLL